MSLGYAEKLSYREDIGKVGMPELFDTPNAVQQKIEELAKLIQESRHLVAFTGAGISTSCGIPDFRGPNGIWTLQHEGKPLPKADVPFHQARPGFTHMALVALQHSGILKFIISQNIDGLHLKSGIPRDALAELHGNSFREVCSLCKKEYIRDFEVETIGMKETGRRCSASDCGGKLKDTVLDWEDALPPEELHAAETHCKQADIILCLGTSLQITPACNLPLRTIRAGGKIVIVNLQATPKDKRAALVIHSRVDEVMAGAMSFLNMRIPPFVQLDRFVISYFFSSKPRQKTARWTLRVSSIHGERAPLPFLQSVEIHFPDRPDLKTAFLNYQPFLLRRSTLRMNAFDALLKLHFADGCMQSVEIHYPINFEDVPGKFEGLNIINKEDAIRKMKIKAAQETASELLVPVGTVSEVQRTGSAIEYAVITCIIMHTLPVSTENVKEAQDLICCKVDENGYENLTKKAKVIK